MWGLMVIGPKREVAERGTYNCVSMMISSIKGSIRGAIKGSHCIIMLEIRDGCLV